MSYFYAFNSSGNSLKWRPRLKIFKSGALEFDPELVEGHSYDWCFLKRVNGLVVFNSYRYSNTTTRHQWALKSFLREKKIKIDVEINCMESLNSIHVGENALRNAIRRALREKPGKAPDLTDARKIAKAFALKITKQKIEAVILGLEEAKAEKFLKDSIKRQEKKFNETLRKMGISIQPAPVEDTQPTESTESTKQSEVFPWAA